MYLKRLSFVTLTGLSLASIFYQPLMYSWGINRAAIGRTYESGKKILFEACKQVAPMLVAEGIVLGVEMMFNRIRAGAWGDRSRATHNRKPGVVPADRGHIAPETVPRPIARMIRLINEPDRLRRTGGQMWKGIVLTGDPGVGKSELGYYIARQTGAPVIYESAAGLLGPAQGSGAASVRYLFDRVYGQSIWARVKRFIKNMALYVLRRHPSGPINPLF